MSFAAADIPGRIDVLINGEGYVFLDELLCQNVGFGKHPAKYGFSPTFIERSNVSGDYGDNQQDFYLTISGRDWSLGENQSFYRGADELSSRRYYLGSNVDIRIPGQVTLRPASTGITFAANIRSTTSAASGLADWAIGPSGGNLYKVTGDGVIVSQGAHGLGGDAGNFGLVDDGTAVYMASTGAGSVGVRKMTVSGGAFATFSATKVSSLEFLNNTLYGVSDADLNLYRFDTAGTATSLYIWKDGQGNARPNFYPLRMRAFGGKLLILFRSFTGGSELWQYDGSSTSQVAAFPRNFMAWDMIVYGGLVFVTGSIVKAASATTYQRKPAVYYYNAGSIGELWKGTDYISAEATSLATVQGPGISAFDNGCVFHDFYAGSILYYDAYTGGVSTIVGSDTGTRISSTQSFFMTTLLGGTAGAVFPATTTATTGFVQTSMIDFDSSLPKYIAGVTLDADIPTGATLDISYALNTQPPTSFTSLQTGAVAGTEYAVSQSARSVALKVTLNKGSSTPGPTLRRVKLRAAPVLNAYELNEYVLNCSGRTGEQMLVLRDGTDHPKDGLSMATDLRTAKRATTPITIVDPFGSFSGVIEELELLQFRQEEYYVRLTVRKT